MRVTQPLPHSDDLQGHAVPLRVDVVRGGPATVVHVAGELDASSAPELGTVLEAVGQDARMVALDLGETSFIDSAGIRVLVRSLWNLQDAGSTLRLVSASPAAENILRITGILDVLKDPTP